MTHAEFIAILEEVTTASPGAIKGDENIADLPGWDSLCAATFMVLLANKWNIQLSGVEVDKCRRVPELAKLAKVSDSPDLSRYARK